MFGSGLKMYRLALIACIFVLTFSFGKCQGPPSVYKSYKAWGEMVNKVEDMPGEIAHEYFEESYDKDSQNAAFVVTVAGKNATFIENFETKQILRYTEGDSGQPVTCDVLNPDDWKNSKYPPYLEGYEVKKGVVRFALRQLFSLKPDELSKDAPVMFRNISARKWVYKYEHGEGDTTTVYAYWSDPSWSTTSPEDSVPLGYVISRMVYAVGSKKVALQETFINVFGFVPGTFERKVFEPREGIVCNNRAQTLKFPISLNFKTVAMHSEVILPDTKEIKYMDVWFNPKSKRLRRDVHRILDEDPLERSDHKRYESEIAVGNMGVVFKKTFHNGKYKCEVTPFGKYVNDIQNIFNIKAPLSEWKLTSIFGVEKTSYTYTGKTSKADIPCHLFQGIRTDWPDADSKVKSLWEWCFNVNMSKVDTVLFRTGEFGVVSARVTVLESGNSSAYSKGFEIYHHFYEVGEDRTNAIMDATVFDISACFSSSQVLPLEFTVDWKVMDDNKHMVINATSDMGFLKKWRQAIYKHSGLPTYSLRVSNVKAIVIKNELIVRFLLLERHPGLPADVKEKQKSASDAYSRLEKRVNEGELSIEYKPESGSESLILGVWKNDLRWQVGSNLVPYTQRPPALRRRSEPASPSALQTKALIKTKSYSSDSGSSSTVSSTSTVGSSTGGGKTTGGRLDDGALRKPAPETKQEQRPSYHQKGTILAASISALVIGLSIGGGATLIKYNGVPNCKNK